MKNLMLIPLFIPLYLSIPIKELHYFENFNQKKINISIDLLPTNILFQNPDNVLVDLQLLEEPNKTKKLTNKIFDQLYAIDLINRNYLEEKDSYRSPFDTYEEHLLKNKKATCLYYLGKIRISPHFESYLILADYDYSDPCHIDRNLFLINFKSSELNSIVLLSQYFCFEGDAEYLFTEINSDNTFSLKQKRFSSYQTESQKLPEIPNLPVLLLKFSFDKNGFVKI